MKTEKISYTGNGAYGSDNPLVLNFSGVPKFLTVSYRCRTDRSNGNKEYNVLIPSATGMTLDYQALLDFAVRDMWVGIAARDTNAHTRYKISNGGKTLTIYGQTAELQFNIGPSTSNEITTAYEYIWTAIY